MYVADANTLSTYLHRLLSSQRRARDIWGTKEGVNLAVNADVSSPSKNLRISLEEGSTHEVKAHTEPVQNVGHCPFKLPPLLPPCNQVDRYGDLTANGIAGGLKGVDCQLAAVVWRETTAALEVPNTVAATTANAEKKCIARGAIPSE